MNEDTLFFEDMPPGFRVELGTRTLSRERIISFASEFDPLPFHLDEKAAKASLLGGLAASGWQTAGLSLRLLTDAFLDRIDSQGGLGFSDLKWRKPVMVDDTITGEARIVSLRRSRRHPERGIVTIAFDIRNQRGEQVMTMNLANLVGLRDPAAPFGGSAA